MYGTRQPPPLNIRRPGRSLPQLIDCAGIQSELGVTEHAALAIMRQLPKVTIPGVRKVYVKRSDLLRLIDESTVAA